MTTTEFDSMQRWLEMRRRTKEALDRDPNATSAEILGPPATAIHTAEGAAYWILSVIWQDAPGLLILGGLGICFTVIRLIWHTIVR